MIVSRSWLQKQFDASLPDAQTIADAFTFHAFEIDSMEKRDADDIFDVKVLPNRASDCLSHRGLARELGAILDLPLKPDTLRAAPPVFPKTEEVSVSVEDARACPRYIGALVRGVKVGPSPVWLKDALESVGQRSINNVVDATNYVMLDLGQPLHAFDAARLTKDAEGHYAIAVRSAKSKEETEDAQRESITTLSGDELKLPPGALVIVDANADKPIGIAGIKGGKAAEITEQTTDILLEAANFDAAMVRRASQKLKLFTDASKRFQNNVSPELAAYAMQEGITLIQGVAGGELVGAVDKYPAPQETKQVSVSVAQANALIGFEYSANQLEDAFRRLGFAYKKTADVFTIDPPFERRDISIPEDLIEEVGRIHGYDAIPPLDLSPLEGEPDQARFRGIERMKDQLAEQGFSEVSTQSFAKKGEIPLANPLDDARPWLRTSLEAGLQDALAQAKQYAPRILKPNEKPKLFEVGTVFAKAEDDGEYVELRMTERVPEWGEAVGAADNLSVAKLEDYGKDYTPARVVLGRFKPFSNYPFILRDIALWVPAGTAIGDIERLIRAHASALLVSLDLFDRFEKEGRVSYAFRLVFEAMDRTLSDEEINPLMAAVGAAAKETGWEVR